MTKNAAFFAAVDRCADALRGVPDTVIGPALGQLVRGGDVDAAALPHRPALLRLAFLQHVLQPALQTGALVTSMMRTMLVEAGASTLEDMLDDIKSALAVADEEGSDVRLWLLIDEGLRAGFVGTRAQAAARAGELWDLDDATVERLLAEGVPRGR